MAAIPCALLRQEITLEAYLGEAGAGGPVFGPPVTVRARVEGRRRVLRRPDGSVQVSTATAIVLPGVTAGPEDRATVAGQPYEVAERVEHLGLTRASHVELVLADIDPRAT